MSEKERMDDAEFAHEILEGLPTVPVPAALEARILADFDRVAVRRTPTGVRGGLARIGERLWPGVPVWQPASVFALSLVIGLTAGALVPSSLVGSNTSSDLVLASADTPPAMELDRDQ